MRRGRFFVSRLYLCDFYNYGLTDHTRLTLISTKGMLTLAASLFFAAICKLSNSKKILCGETTQQNCKFMIVSHYTTYNIFLRKKALAIWLKEDVYLWRRSSSLWETDGDFVSASILVHRLVVSKVQINVLCHGSLSFF